MMVHAGDLPKGRGQSMSTGMHVDPAMVMEAADLDEDPDAGDLPPGAARFAVDAEEIADALAAGSAEVCFCWCAVCMRF